MTVAELIGFLQTLDPSMAVISNDDSYGERYGDANIKMGKYVKEDAFFLSKEEIEEWLRDDESLDPNNYEINAVAIGTEIW